MTSLKCKLCSKPTLHHESCDTMFCLVCNTWNEGHCGYEDCDYCNKRPDVPLNDDQYKLILKAIEKDGFDPVFIAVSEVLDEQGYL